MAATIGGSGLAAEGVDQAPTAGIDGSARPVGESLGGTAGGAPPSRAESLALIPSGTTGCDGHRRTSTANSCAGGASSSASTAPAARISGVATDSVPPSSPFRHHAHVTSPHISSGSTGRGRPPSPTADSCAGGGSSSANSGDKKRSRSAPPAPVPDAVAVEWKKMTRTQRNAHRCNHLDFGTKSSGLCGVCELFVDGKGPPPPDYLKELGLRRAKAKASEPTAPQAVVAKFTGKKGRRAPPKLRAPKTAPIQDQQVTTPTHRTCFHGLINAAAMIEGPETQATAADQNVAESITESATQASAVTTTESNGRGSSETIAETRRAPPAQIPEELHGAISSSLVSTVGAESADLGPHFGGNTTGIVRSSMLRQPSSSSRAGNLALAGRRHRQRDSLPRVAALMPDHMQAVILQRFQEGLQRNGVGSVCHGGSHQAGGPGIINSLTSLHAGPGDSRTYQLMR